uniref:Serpentine receptor class gamma n=1 Tax=Haemonchus placei TaxID=6290 RepID=A0A0N4VZZ1_HAEPC
LTTNFPSFQYHYCMLYMALPSRITIILYALKIIDVPGGFALRVVFYSSNNFFLKKRIVISFIKYPTAFMEADNCKATENLHSTPPFLIVCYVNIFCKSMLSIALLTTLMERFIASHYISDYETKSRPWIAVAAIIISFSTSSLCTFALFTGKERFEFKTTITTSVGFSYRVICYNCLPSFLLLRDAR